MKTTLQELHDDIEAALFAVAGHDRSREMSLAATKLEEALLWTKRAIERQKLNETVS